MTSAAQKMVAQFGRCVSPHSDDGRTVTAKELTSILEAGLTKTGQLADGPAQTFQSLAYNVLDPRKDSATDATRKEYTRLAKKYRLAGIDYNGVIYQNNDPTKPVYQNDPRLKIAGGKGRLPTVDYDASGKPHVKR